MTHTAAPAALIFAVGLLVTVVQTIACALGGFADGATLAASEPPTQPMRAGWRLGRYLRTRRDAAIRARLARNRQELP